MVGLAQQPATLHTAVMGAWLVVVDVDWHSSWPGAARLCTGAVGEGGPTDRTEPARQPVPWRTHVRQRLQRRRPLVLTNLGLVAVAALYSSSGCCRRCSPSTHRFRSRRTDTRPSPIPAPAWSPYWPPRASLAVLPTRPHPGGGSLTVLGFGNSPGRPGGWGSSRSPGRRLTPVVSGSLMDVPAVWLV